ncbi:MAG TPA: hypothetical protein DCG32_05705 [Sphaerochaeta sp.]|nr:hypothetical protein [Sphaerochaeta sp.]
MLLFGINPDSLPASTCYEAKEMLLAVIRGMNKLSLAKQDPDIQICYDPVGIRECIIGDGTYTIGVFLNDEASSPEYRDAVAFLLEVNDRSPIIDYLDEVELNEITRERVLLFGVKPISSEFFYYLAIRHGCLLSFQTSSLWLKPWIPLEIYKDEGVQTCLLANVWGDDISGLLDTEEILQCQFFLEDESRFVRTSRFNKRSVIYKEKASNRYWYLDDFHRSHFEVFDSSTGDHLGEASVDAGFLDTSKQDPAKSLKL